MTDSGERIIMVIQKGFQVNLKDGHFTIPRFPIRSGQKRGIGISLKAVYCISVLDFRLSDKPEDGNFVHRVGLVNRLTRELFSNKLHIIYLKVSDC